MDKPVIYKANKVAWLPEKFNEKNITKSFRLIDTIERKDIDNNLNNEKKEQEENLNLNNEIMLMNDIIALENELDSVNKKYIELLKNYKYVLRVNKLYEKLIVNINK
uniref:Uncharacterized protein n=1 Tax=viral metagenome TaxID=1070528 RepID=A0A6C0AYB7_9ZZZZ|tara:strand:+ start:40846 stop:41166 length:321 start_codon:yes stop_codon:yes gene_type:complete